MKKKARPSLPSARRVVIKIGSRVLVQRNGRPDIPRIAQLVRSVSTLHAQNREIVLVSSGAIAAGLQALGLHHRPTDLPSLQMAATIGQTRLMSTYADLFAHQHILVGQVLLTHDDLRDRHRHLNARSTALKLLENRVIPIINENDAVSCEEIRFGDNDALASRTAMLIEADLLIYLTVVGGFYAPSPSGQIRRLPTLQNPSPAAFDAIYPNPSPFSTGGMASKLHSAIEAARLGIPVVIANGRHNAVLEKIIAGNNVGTLIPPTPSPSPAPTRRRRWVAYFHNPKGSLTIDAGAATALKNQGRSLLPVGIHAIDGPFSRGDLVRILDPNHHEIARGLAEHSADELRLLLGRSSRDIHSLLGPHAPTEAVHRDNLILLPPPTQRIK